MKRPLKITANRLKQTYMGIFLYFLALTLEIILVIPNAIHTVLAAVRRESGAKNIWSRINRRFREAALSRDVACNESYAEFFNDWFIKKGGYHYGYKGETLSSATGKNQAIRKQSWLGVGLRFTLNLVDYTNWKNGGHCRMSIKQPWVFGRSEIPLWYEGWPYGIVFILLSSSLLYSLISLTIFLLRITISVYDKIQSLIQFNI